MSDDLRFDRRRFVLLGTASVAGLTVGLPVFGSTPETDTFVSVGYQAARSGRGMGRRGASAPASASAGFTDARSVLSGDPRFFQAGARFRIHDFHRSSERAPERVDVEMLYSAPELAEPARFFAFSSVDRPGRPMTSSPIAFTVPVESTGRVEITVERRALHASGTLDRASLLFDVNDGLGGSFKLNEGLYALALLRRGEAAPHWPSIRTAEAHTLDRKEPNSLLTDRYGATAPVPFDYLLLTVTRVIPAGEEVQTDETSPAALAATEPEQGGG